VDAVASIMSASTSRVVLAALLAASHLRPMMAERPETSFTDESVEDSPITNQDEGASEGEEQSALMDVADAAPGQAAASPLRAESPGGGATCATFFGSLNEVMTIVDLDPAGGCVKEMDPQNAVIRFVGGSDSTCQPPLQGDGCHRYIVSRYSDDCNMSPLKDKLGQEISLTLIKETDPIGQDGVYKMCNQAGLLQSRTLFYVGDNGDSENSCNEITCGCNDGNAATGCVGHGDDDAASAIEESVATRASLFWVCHLSAAVITSWLL